MIEWYCYEHINGTYHLRRYFTHEDINEARESPFVRRIRGPFEAENHKEAMRHMKEVFRVAKEIEDKYA